MIRFKCNLCGKKMHKMPTASEDKGEHDSRIIQKNVKLVANHLTLVAERENT